MNSVAQQLADISLFGVPLTDDERQWASRHFAPWADCRAIGRAVMNYRAAPAIARWSEWEKQAREMI